MKKIIVFIFLFLGYSGVFASEGELLFKFDTGLHIDSEQKDLIYKLISEKSPGDDFAKFAAKLLCYKCDFKYWKYPSEDYYRNSGSLKIEDRELETIRRLILEEKISIGNKLYLAYAMICYGLELTNDENNEIQKLIIDKKNVDSVTNAHKARLLAKMIEKDLIKKGDALLVTVALELIRNPYDIKVPECKYLTELAISMIKKGYIKKNVDSDIDCALQIILQRTTVDTNTRLGLMLTREMLSVGVLLDKESLTTVQVLLLLNLGDNFKHMDRYNTGLLFLKLVVDYKYKLSDIVVNSFNNSYNDFVKSPQHNFGGKEFISLYNKYVAMSSKKNGNEG